jgi:hypothetical protein
MATMDKAQRRPLHMSHALRKETSYRTLSNRGVSGTGGSYLPAEHNGLGCFVIPLKGTAYEPGASFREHLIRRHMFRWA